MGIKGIISILPDPKSVTPEDFKDQKIAVDTSIYLYKFVYGYGADKFISGFAQLLNAWKKSKMLFIFDGPPPELKRKILEKRKLEKENNPERIKITPEMIQELKNFFDEKNIEYKVAPGEAEKTAAHMNMGMIIKNTLGSVFDKYPDIKKIE